MNKNKTVMLLLLMSLALNLYLFLKLYGKEFNELISSLDESGVIYREECPKEVVRSRVCSIEVLEKRSDFAMIRVHYHYVKGEEHTNRIVVKAHKGSHDNVVGTRGGFGLIEGENSIDIPFGMYRADTYREDQPYISKYIMVEAKGITEDGKRYTSPHIFRVFADYEHPWFTIGEASSWR